MDQYLSNLDPFMHTGIVVLAAIVIGLVLHFVFWRVLKVLSGRTDTVLDDSLMRHCRQPSRLIFPLITLQFASPAIRSLISEDLMAVLSRILMIILVLSVAWLVIRLTNVLEDVMLAQYRLDVADNLRARKINTQVRIIKRIVAFATGIVALGIILMGIDEVRQLGTGILASAGIAGLVVGLAAQRTLSNLLAGIQIAFTQPITLDDVVIVENEWGWVEEITLTYVVVRVWDLRRVILPISYFLEKPFQNWTRTTADILGTVYLYMDYTVPVEAIREELNRVVNGHKDWDGKVAGVVVTNAREHCIEVRALVGSPSSGQAWNLRCHVREKLIEFLQQNYPHALPRVRLVQEESESVKTHSGQ